VFGGARVERASVHVEIPADIHKAMWDKFLLVVSFGGMGALTLAPIGVIRTMPETRRLLEYCKQEVEEVADATSGFGGKCRCQYDGVSR
jgi:2-dehydropantoate 2-reductase